MRVVYAEKKECDGNLRCNLSAHNEEYTLIKRFNCIDASLAASTEMPLIWPT